MLELWYEVLPKWSSNDGSRSGNHPVGESFGFQPYEYIGWTDGWMTCNFNSVISGGRAGDHEMLCSVEPCLRVGRFRFLWGSNYGLLGQ